MRIGLVIASLLLLSSCIKEELPVPVPVLNADIVPGQVCLGSTYNNQTYFDLGTNAVVHSHSKEAWDLAINTDINNPFIVLNSARLMRAGVAPFVSLTQVTDTLAIQGDFLIDLSTGNIDSLAIDLGNVSNNVVVLDMGYTHFGLHLGFMKFRLQSFTQTSFTIEYAPLYSIQQNSFQTITVQADPNANLSYISFVNGSQVYMEPPLKSFDLLFTQYSVYFADDNLQYLVVGALSNRNGVRVAQLDGLPFLGVQLADTLDYPLSNDLDVIGYDWKTFDFDLGEFIIHPEKIYIVQDAHGAFYKMRFVDFYDDSGQKGCPQFEVIAL